MRARPIRAALAAVLLGVALLVAACGDPGPAPTPPPTALPTAVTAASPTPAATTSLATPAGCTLPRGAAAPVLDPSLMSILPAAVSGIAVTQEPDSFTQAIADQCFVANVDRAVFAIAVSGNDLASGVVAHLRPGVYSEPFFADWRASYDDGACAQSSGVVAQADQALGGRTIYVTTCGGGLRVYHAYLAGKGVIVSLFSTGPNGFGEQLMGRLAG